MAFVLAHKRSRDMLQTEVLGCAGLLYQSARLSHPSDLFTHFLFSLYRSVSLQDFFLLILHLFPSLERGLIRVCMRIMTAKLLEMSDSQLFFFNPVPPSSQLFSTAFFGYFPHFFSTFSASTSVCPLHLAIYILPHFTPSSASFCSA